ncbi:glycosyltransferase [Gehongia tenuis]|uniref:Glycosyltransferase n=1 Tax=Gehongia tenuis TaxID=2763655 RepID=A0A926D4N8_9FIRM|nr:glycosyltransferase [Gehongia tenuis]MBC8530280.1 glycosyltransferase [Gehongia tenuis]
MDQPRISVIIPVYNTAKYLAACLDSALNQSLQEAEFLCINDGSTDGSPEILAKYAQKDSRLRVLTKENEGLSVARNLGIAEARGEYLCFLDSDDLIQPGALQAMYEAASPEQLDLLVFDFDLLHDGGPEIGGGRPDAWRRKRHHDGLKSGEAMYVEMLREGDYRCMAWGQCLRRAFLQETGHRFVPGMVHEDELFTLNALLLAQKVRHLHRSLYVYRLRQGSIMNSPYSFAKLSSRIKILLDEAKLALSPELSQDTRECIAAVAQDLLQNTLKIYAGWLPGRKS